MWRRSFRTLRSLQPVTLWEVTALLHQPFSSCCCFLLVPWSSDPLIPWSPDLCLPSGTPSDLAMLSDVPVAICPATCCLLVACLGLLGASPVPPSSLQMRGDLLGIEDLIREASRTL